jgi:hypothetical protein
MPTTSTSRPLQTETTIALGFALGMLSQMPPSKRAPGLLAGVADELGVRGQLPGLLASMGSHVSHSLSMAIHLDRAQAHNAARRRAHA